MITILFVWLVCIGVLLGYAAFRVDAARYYALAGGSFYAASFLAGFSLGVYLLAIPAVLWALALRAAVPSARDRVDRGWAAGLGIASWLLSVFLIDDAWLFFPLGWLA